MINQIINGDCLQVMKEIQAKSIDMILCDLPYGTTNCKWDVIIPFQDLWREYERVIKDNGAIVLTACQPFSSLLICSNIHHFKYDLVWDKKRPTGQLNVKRQPLRQHESILIFYKKQPTYNPIMHENRLKRSFLGFSEKSKKQSDNYGSQHDYISDIKSESLSYPRSIIEQTTVIGNSKEKLSHPTQKPVALFEYLINTYTNENDLVLDNCIGSGTTAVACINTNRRFIGIEKDNIFYQMSLDRIRNHATRKQYTE